MKKLLFIVGICMSSLVFSDCSDDANNFLQNANCDFTSNTIGWTLGSGDSLTHDASDDFLSASPGAAIVDALEILPGSIYVANINQCFTTPIDASNKTIGVWYKGVSGQADCEVQATFYSNTGCSATNVNSCVSINPDITSTTDWINFSCDVPLITATQSVRFEMFCMGAVDHQVKVDNAYIVSQGGLPVELQEFSIE